MMTKHRHPVSFLKRLVRRWPDISGFEFGVYKYKPQAFIDQRRLLKVPASDCSEGWHALDADFSDDYEVALHSRVQLSDGGQLYQRHILMLDFRWLRPERDLKCVAENLDFFGANEFELYSSGRSFHLYGLALVDQETWIHFMGRSLLLNPPGGPEIVDSRWIGHRLLAGYGSLRWTKRSTRYLATPELYRRYQTSKFLDRDHATQLPLLSTLSSKQKAWKPA